ncbi:MAG: formylglycine-generating enzyme family protein [Dysgonamonadaceae bacterium]|jgi:hypothetical protein|nr:formylglycine-generating enzyme family protein [Dysgonamonadaceae bacterium]
MTEKEKRIDILKQIIAKFKKPIFDKNEKARLESLLADCMAAEDKNVLKLFRLAVKDGITHELLQCDTLEKLVQKIKINSLRVKFREDNSLEESKANYVIDCFASALGLEPGLINNIEMVSVSGGRFRQWSDKFPRDVTLSAFSISKTPVSVGLWDEIMKGKNAIDGNSLVSISWDDTQKFIIQLNRTTGEKYRLPTEAELDFAISNKLITVSDDFWYWCADWYEDRKKLIKEFGKNTDDPKGPPLERVKVEEGYCKVQLAKGKRQGAPLSFKDIDTGFLLCLDK